MEWPMIWIAIHTHSQKEALANMHIMRLGIETFFPHYRDRQWARKSKTLSELAYRAYLPRYTFARTDVGMVSAINTLPGVSTVLYRPGGDPCPIEDEVMLELAKATDSRGWVHRHLEKPVGFEGKAGDIVKLGEKSPLFGFMAEIKKVVDNKKIIARLQANLFGMSGREIEVPIAEIGELIPVGLVAGSSTLIASAS
jgi:transcription antitermination factor NusG